MVHGDEACAAITRGKTPTGMQPRCSWVVRRRAGPLQWRLSEASITHAGDIHQLRCRQVFEFFKDLCEHQTGLWIGQRFDATFGWLTGSSAELVEKAYGPTRKLLLGKHL
jgi:hypothetical protein